MSAFLNLKTRVKLAIGFGVMLLLTLVLGLIGWKSAESIHLTNDKIANEDVLRLQGLVDVTSAGGWMRRAAINMGNATDVKSGQKGAKRYDEAKAAYDEAYTRFRPLVKDPSELKVLEKLDSAKAAYVGADDANRALAWSGSLDEFRRVVNKEGRDTLPFLMRS